jgi:hypothetical protein
MTDPAASGFDAWAAEIRQPESGNQYETVSSIGSMGVQQVGK